MSGNNDPVLAKLERLEKLLKELQTGVNYLRSDIKDLRSDIKDLRSTTNDKFEMLGRSYMAQNANYS